jgi:hypothetical protein
MHAGVGLSEEEAVGLVVGLSEGDAVGLTVGALVGSLSDSPKAPESDRNLCPV